MKTTKMKLALAIALSIGLTCHTAARGQEDAGAEQSKTTLKLKTNNKKTTTKKTGKAKAAAPPKASGNSTKVRIKLPGKNGKIVTPGANQRLSSGSGASSVLPRMQRTPSGNLKPGALAEMQAEKNRANSAQKTANRKIQLKPGQQPSSGQRKLSGSSSRGAKTSSAQKTANRKFQLKPGSQSTAPPSGSNASSAKRNAGQFQSPKSLARQGTTTRPSTALNKQRVPSTTRRMGGTFQSPKTLKSTASSNRPATTPKKIVKSTAPKSKAPKSKFKMGGKTSKALGGLAVGSALVGSASQMKDAKKLRDSGQITKSQYQKMQANNGLKTAESIAKIKKFNPATAVMNDVIGTDPISLGFDAVGDVFNGTDNAKQSLKNVGKAWDKSLTKQTFTDPKAAGKRVGDGVKNGLETTGKNIQRGAQNVDKFLKQQAANHKQAQEIMAAKRKQAIENAKRKVDKAANGVKNHAQQVGNNVKRETRKVANNVKKTTKKAANNVKNGARKVGDAIGGLFKKKKKK